MPGVAPKPQVLSAFEAEISPEARRRMPTASVKPKGRVLQAARASQERAAAAGRGCNCNFPADICFSLSRLGSPEPQLRSEAAAQGRALQVGHGPAGVLMWYTQLHSNLKIIPQIPTS